KQKQATNDARVLPVLRRSSFKAPRASAGRRMGAGPEDRVQDRPMPLCRSTAARALAASALALAAACGAPGAAPRAAVPSVDPVSGELVAAEQDLPGADLSAVRGPAGAILVGAAIQAGQLVGGASPECAL